MSSKLNAGILFSKADPIASERQANGVGGGFVLTLLLKTFTLALLSHHNSIAQRWKSPVLACLRQMTTATLSNE